MEKVPIKAVLLIIYNNVATNHRVTYRNIPTYSILIR